MVRHIVAWNFKEGFTEAENRENALRVKAEIEALPQWIDGIVKIEVKIDLMSTSTRAVVLDSLFVSEEALEAYVVHPEHKRAAAFVGSVFQDRVCLDYHE